MGRTKGIAAIATLLIATKVFAGPDATTQFMMDDPASLLDLSMVRLNQMLARDGLGFADFLWDANQFVIYAPSAISSSTTTAEGIEAACGAWVEAVRKRAGLNEKGIAILGTSSFTFSFRHYGYQSKAEPKDLDAEIDKHFYLSCFGFTSGGTISITAPLLGTGYSVKKG